MRSEAPPRTLTEAFQRTAARHPDGVAIRSFDDATTITWAEYARRVRSIALGLAGLGVGPGDTVALMMANRPEFHLVDTAALHIGATPFSMYNTNPSEMLGYLFDNADAKVVVCEKQFLSTVLAGKELGGKVEHVVCIDGSSEGVLSLAEVEAAPALDFDFDSAWCAVDSGDLLTIVYTSGTTGQPKGVEITHANLIANARLIDELGSTGFDDRVISYLPDAHMANRWVAHYHNILTGIQVTTVADAKHVIDALTTVRPTVFLGVPRVWVKIKASIESTLAGESGLKKELGDWALRTGRTKARAVSERHNLGIIDRLQDALADRLVLAGIRAKLGLDSARIVVSGAAPIPPEVHEFVAGLGIPLVGGWGMTECTCGVTIDQPKGMKIGTVGRACAGSEIKLADDGEILARGPMVMRGYRKEPEKTSEAIDPQGWMHTGDIGAIDAEGYLTIVDRKKELIINAAGKNMSPANIESAILANTGLVAVAVAIGDARPYNTALIMLDPELAAKFAADNGIGGPVDKDSRLREVVQGGIDKANAKLSRVEQIKKFTIVDETWVPGGEYLTPKGSLKRRQIAGGYAEHIEAMYPAI